MSDAFELFKNFQYQSKIFFLSNFTIDLLFFEGYLKIDWADYSDWLIIQLGEPWEFLQGNQYK